MTLPTFSVSARQILKAGVCSDVDVCAWICVCVSSRSQATGPRTEHTLDTWSHWSRTCVRPSSTRGVTVGAHSRICIVCVGSATNVALSTHALTTACNRLKNQHVREIFRHARKGGLWHDGGHLQARWHQAVGAEPVHRFIFSRRACAGKKTRLRARLTAGAPATAADTPAAVSFP